MTALGIDLGTTFGYAFIDPYDRVYIEPTIKADRYGSHTLKKKPKEPIGIRYQGFNVWLQTYATGVHAIYYEDVKNHAGVLAAHMYGGYLAVLQMFAYRQNIELVPLGVGTVKKFATGKGNASKDEMIATAKELGYDPQDDNAADAIHILRCGLSMIK